MGKLKSFTTTYFVISWISLFTKTKKDPQNRDGLTAMDGVLIIDKPAGFTSHDAVARMRKILNERRVGHTGTLDPFATGVLVILIGQATRLAQFLSGADKQYHAVVRLGFRTDTADVTGKPVASPTKENWSASVTNEAIEAACKDLRGEIDQVPPMFSAKKQGGKKLYELARRGEEVERAPRRVTIHSLELASTFGPALERNADGTIDVAIEVTCSAGTYIRTLAEDFGGRLGVGAHLATLRRTRAGNFHLNDALQITELESRPPAALREMLLSPDAALRDLPHVDLNNEDVRKTQQGIALDLSHQPQRTFSEGENVRMRTDKGLLIAVGSYDHAARLLRPRVVLATETS